MLTLPDFKQKQIVIAMLSHGEKLSFKHDNVTVYDKDGKIKYQSTCYRLVCGGTYDDHHRVIAKSQKILFFHCFADSRINPLWGLAGTSRRERAFKKKTI